MPGERILEHLSERTPTDAGNDDKNAVSHLSERAPTDAGSHDKHDYIGYYTNIDYIFVYLTDIANMCQTTWRVITLLPGAITRW